ncbi:hypothetical protein OF83DRAFT_1147037 [Amylostereum chailletii]|nr:hypothetical protein OF83DRAFT_1147037 [Amylostereum chailletii]
MAKSSNINVLPITAGDTIAIRHTVLWPHKSVDHAGWYERRGLVAYGETFLKSGIEYVRMKISL